MDFCQTIKITSLAFKVIKITKFFFVNFVSSCLRRDLYFSLFLCGDCRLICYSSQCLITSFQFVIDKTACPL